MWCELMAFFIVEPLFFNEMGPVIPVTSTVNGKHYKCLLRNQIIPTLQQCTCLDRMIFMQDGSPLHIAKPVMQLLKKLFRNDRIISRHFLTACPSTSLDLKPRYFLL